VFCYGGIEFLNVFRYSSCSAVSVFIHFKKVKNVSCFEACINEGMSLVNLSLTNICPPPISLKCVLIWLVGCRDITKW
jgi:hypothetical protein